MRRPPERLVPSGLPAILGIVFRILPVGYARVSIFLGATLALLLLAVAARASVLDHWLALGIILEAISTGWILWAVLYSAQHLEKENPRFVSLIAGRNEHAQNWISDEIEKVYSGLVPVLIVAGMTLALMGTVMFVIGVPPASEAHLSIWQIVFESAFLVFSVVAGFGMSTVLLIGRFMVRYARQDLRVSIYQQPFSHFRFIGLLQLRFAWITALGFLMASGMTLCYWQVQWATLFWLILGLVIVLGFFFLPQYRFHLMLRNKKLLELEGISEKIQNAFGESILDPKQLPKLKDLYDIAKMIENIPEWPFNARVVISVLGSGLLTQLPIIAKLIYGTFFK